MRDLNSCLKTKQVTIIFKKKKMKYANEEVKLLNVYFDDLVTDIVRTGEPGAAVRSVTKSNRTTTS